MVRRSVWDREFVCSIHAVLIWSVIMLDPLWTQPSVDNPPADVKAAFSLLREVRLGFSSEPTADAERLVVQWAIALDNDAIIAKAFPLIDSPRRLTDRAPKFYFGPFGGAMSVVSSVLLQIHCAENEFTENERIPDYVPPGIQRINDWLDERGKMSLVQLDEQMCCGKHPQTLVFGGGYNHFPEDDFAEFILSLHWDNPENVVLIINPEEGPTRVWRPKWQ